MAIQDLLDDLLRACRILGWYGTEDLIWGHVGVRDPHGRGVWMKSSGYGFEEMTQELLVLVDETGTTRAGAGRRHIEYPIHTEIMKARPDVDAVVHTHWPHVVAFAATGMPLLPISHDSTLFSPDGVPRYDSGALITTSEQGRALAASLGKHPAVLLAHHGMVAVGSDLAEAVVTAVMLERAARYQLLAASAGRPLSYSDDDEATSKRRVHFSAGSVAAAWAYLCRRVERQPETPPRQHS